MQIVDLHTHTYPRPEIGRQALQGEGWSPYAGTVPELREAMTRGGIATAVMANLTPVADMHEAALTRLSPTLSAAERAEAEARHHWPFPEGLPGCGFAAAIRDGYRQLTGPWPQRPPPARG